LINSLKLENIERKPRKKRNDLPRSETKSRKENQTKITKKRDLITSSKRASNINLKRRELTSPLRSQN
jgi:hypothetical protein